jgi:HEPN domain-containing protein
MAGTGVGGLEMGKGALAKRGGYHVACFLAQQVGEKALKAFLYAKGEEVVIGRSAERLCTAAARFDEEFAEKVKTWSILDGYYVTTRYPNSLPDSIPARVYTAQAATDAANIAAEIVNFVRHKISQSKFESDSESEQ